MSNSAKKIALGVSLIAVLIAAWVSVVRRTDDALVVYCAHDLIFAEEILHDFEKETGIKVIIVGDTEATKSLGLVQRLIREKNNPKCDLFWNNQVLGTIDLAEQGLLQPYKGPGYERIPSQFKDPEGLWTGFAGRMRVWIYNNETVTGDEQAIVEQFETGDLSRMAIAMPIYGTTLSHFSILWQDLGEKGMKAWFEDLQQRGCKIVPGNSTVKNLVAEGVCDIGWTDSDDFFVGLDDGADVSMLPIRVNGKTICLPNSVAIIRGTKKQDDAARLMDYLLSEKIELALAKSAARQIPLGPFVSGDLPDDVKSLAEWAKESVDVTQFSQSRNECLKWLESELLEQNPVAPLGE